MKTLTLIFFAGALMAQDGSAPTESIAAKQKELDAANVKIAELTKQISLAEKIVFKLRVQGEQCNFDFTKALAKQEAEAGK